MSGVLDAVVDVWVDGNHQVARHRNLVVSPLDHGFHEVLESVTDDSCSKVDNELLVEATNLLWITWEEGLKIQVMTKGGKNIISVEELVR